MVGGFTLVETMFAVFILTFTIVGLMTVVANSLFAARYARDEITASYLLQEVVDYVRNDRDTTVFLGAVAGPTTWANFLTKYNNCSNDGCYFDVLNPNGSVEIKRCLSSGCPFLYYDAKADTTPFYVNDDGNGMSDMLKTNFQRKILVTQSSENSDEIDVAVTVYWKNGGLTKSRSLTTSLLKWQ